ncbi:hypothetical protein ABZX88_30935, partial [Kitasatospora aureofaciens]
PDALPISATGFTRSLRRKSDRPTSCAPPRLSACGSTRRPRRRPPSAPRLAQLQDQSGDAAAAPWLTVLGRAVARGEAAPEVLHPRVATVAVVLLRNEFVVRGVPSAPDDVLVEIVDEVYLPLVRRRSAS